MSTLTLACLLIVSGIALCHRTGEAALVPLTMTVPSTNAYVEGDSVYTCEGGEPTADVAWIRFRRYYVTGGGYQLFDSLDVRGKEGQQVTLMTDTGPGAHYTAQPVDTLGNAGCVSDPVYKPGYVTAVGDEPVFIPGKVEWYDVMGRGPFDKPQSQGIYWRVQTVAGKRISRKVVVLR